MYDILSVFRLVCFVRLRASGTSVWQEYKVIQTIHDALAKFKSSLGVYLLLIVCRL